MTDTKIFRVGMIGAGSWAREHLAAWDTCKVTEVVAIYNRTTERAEKLAGEFNIADITGDAQEIIERKDIDIISISMPHNMHYDLSNAAVDAGKHVFCEKPLAMNYHEAKDMLERAEKAGVKTGIQFYPRIDPVMIKIKELIEEGYAGTVKHITLTFAADWCADPKFPMTWRFRKDMAGAGALADMGVYIIDSTRWLIGEFKAVSGVLKTHIKKRFVIHGRYDHHEIRNMVRTDTLPDTSETGEVENDDEVFFHALFENGAEGYLMASRVHTNREMKIEGSRGTLIKDYKTNKLFCKKTSESELKEIPVPKKDPNVTMISQFVRNIRQDTDIGPTYYDGMKAQAVIDAVISSAKKKQWVEM
ncbi:Gfo/Idh/MocA family protein [Spirochaetota bacterium]